MEVTEYAELKRVALSFCDLRNGLQLHRTGFALPSYNGQYFMIQMQTDYALKSLDMTARTHVNKYSKIS